MSWESEVVDLPFWDVSKRCPPIVRGPSLRSLTMGSSLTGLGKMLSNAIESLSVCMSFALIIYLVDAIIY